VPGHVLEEDQILYMV